MFYFLTKTSFEQKFFYILSKDEKVTLKNMEEWQDPLYLDEQQKKAIKLDEQLEKALTRSEDLKHSLRKIEDWQDPLILDE